ncbi:hypothetical protein B0H13DRAFT_1850729 [Mycena leptocephala]|nr:hypothetical protein B0H13DRAFT_1850729 [Mycena leptocephala]
MKDGVQNKSAQSNLAYSALDIETVSQEIRPCNSIFVFQRRQKQSTEFLARQHATIDQGTHECWCKREWCTVHTWYYFLQVYNISRSLYRARLSFMKRVIGLASLAELLRDKRRIQKSPLFERRQCHWLKVHEELYLCSGMFPPIPYQSAFSQHLGHFSGLCWIAKSPTLSHNPAQQEILYPSLNSSIFLQISFFGNYGISRDPIKVFLILRILLRSSLLGVLDCFRGINTSDSASGAPQTPEHKSISRGTGLYLAPVSPGRSEVCPVLNGLFFVNISSTSLSLSLAFSVACDVIWRTSVAAIGYKLMRSSTYVPACSLRFHISQHLVSTSAISRACARLPISNTSESISQPKEGENRQNSIKRTLKEGNGISQFERKLSESMDMEALCDEWERRKKQH